MEFFVADAERMLVENGKLQHLSFWSYKLLTRSFLESYQNPPLTSPDSSPGNFIKSNGYIDYCTWHRYSDFEWLADYLQLEFPGILFPPIPSKEAHGTFDKINDLFSTGKDNENASKDNPLVQKRIHLLQLTFNVLAQIKEIHESPILRNFLTLEEKNWVIFREKHSNEVKSSILKTVQSKGRKLFAKLTSIGESSDSFLKTSSFGVIHALQKEMMYLLQTCHSQVENLVKHSTAEVREWCDFDALRKPLDGARLPWTMCFTGHFVQHAEHPGKEGVIRHADIRGNAAWVEWVDKEGELDKVPLQALKCPSSGVSDPAVFAIQELAGHIESYCMYLSRSPQTAALKKLEDTLWFLSRYAKCCTDTIEQIAENEREVQSLIKAISKKPKADQLERLEQTKKTILISTTRFTTQYNEFYCPYVSEALREVAKSFGEVSSKLMCDDEWGERLSRANASLTLRFDVPPQVSLEMSKGASSLHTDFVPQTKKQSDKNQNATQFGGGGDGEQTTYRQRSSLDNNDYIERENAPLGQFKEVPEAKLY